MQRLRLFLTCLSLFACCLVYGQKTNIFSDKLKRTYHDAYKLNSERRYQEAYKTILAAEALLNKEMERAKAKIQDLDKAAIENFYFPIHRTCAEVAYKLGLYMEMQRHSSLLQQVVDEKFGDVDDEADRSYKQAIIAKINGGIYYLKGEYVKSEIEYLRALSLWEYDEELTLTLRSELAQLYYKNELYAYALSQLDAALGNVHRQSYASRWISDETYRQLKSQRAICLARLGRFKEAHNAIDSTFQSNDAESCRKKAKIMMMEYDVTGKYNPKSIRLYQDYLKLSRKYIDENFVQMDASQREQYWLAEQPFVTDCYRLEAAAPALLYDVALFSKAVLLQMGRSFKPQMTVSQKKKTLSSVRVTWQEVKRKMPNSSTAIEFIVYDRADTARLAALVIDKKMSAPQYIDIAAVSDIMNHPLLLGATVGEALVEAEGVYKDWLYSDVGLKTLIWNEKLQRAVGQNKNVYFAPDGFMHQLAVEYLLPNSLADKNVYRLTSTRVLAERQKKFRADNMLICGGIDYSAGEVADTIMANDAQAYSTMYQLELSVNYLSGSKRECDSIISLRACPADTALMGLDATEDAVRALMEDYDIVHLATHGCFADMVNTGTDLMPMQTDEQLSKSCLFLAAANRNLKEKTFNAQRVDGILSAREIALMDLSNTHLAVLSACQTGLGYLTVDGVFGLQRALKTAGVKAMIVSLWNVGDLATSVFFQRVYSHLKQGMPLNTAFMKAREYLKTASVTVYRRRAGLSSIKTVQTFDNPKYYNAFILIDGN